MEEGILAPARSAPRWLHVVLVALLMTCAVRYVLRRPRRLGGVRPRGCGLLVAAYAARPLVAGRAAWPYVWIARRRAVGGATLVAPSFAWTAVPSPSPCSRCSPSRMPSGRRRRDRGRQRGVEPHHRRARPDGRGRPRRDRPRHRSRTVARARGPHRQTLIDELAEAQADLAAAQHHSGALAERTRLSREMHDSVGQGLSSINLLLSAAEQDWDRRPAVARDHVRRPQRRHAKDSTR